MPNVRIYAIQMNSENIFLSKQIEQVDIADPNIEQREKKQTNHQFKKREVLCAPGSRMRVQQCNDREKFGVDDKRVMSISN